MPHVVTCLLKNNGKILLLKRSDKVRTYRGLWGGVAGYVDEHETPYEAALKEIRQEVGIGEDEVSLLLEGESVSFCDRYDGVRYDWVVHPFVFGVKHEENIRIDWEHSEFRWIVPSDIDRYDTVPHLKEIVKKLLW